MFFSRVLQNLQKIKYTNNNCYRKNEYFYYKLKQNKNIRYSNNESKLQSVIIPNRLPKLILNTENKDSNIKDVKDVKDVKDDKYDKYDKYNTIVSSIIVGTTIFIILSSGLYSYIVVKQINLLLSL